MGGGEGGEEREGTGEVDGGGEGFFSYDFELFSDD